MSGNAALGTIDISGLYTAPQLPPNPATVTVKACSRTDSTNCAMASVTVVAGPGNFAELHFWAPQNGTAVGKTASLAANGVLVAGVDAAPQGATDPQAGLVTYGADGSELGEWVNTQPSILTAATYDPASGNVFAVGYTGDNTNPDGHSAMLLELSPANPANVILNKSFQFDVNGNSVSDGSGLRTEARAVTVQDGKIYLAVKSAYERCGLAFDTCSGDWIVTADMSGNVLSKFAVGNTLGIKVGDKTSITGMFVEQASVWAVGNRFKKNTDGSYALVGYYLDKHSLNGDLQNISVVASPSYDALPIEDPSGNLFIAMTNPIPPSEKHFNLERNDQFASTIWSRAWDGDNPVGVNLPHGVFYNQTGFVVLGSLSQIGAADITQTDGGAISWDVNGNLLWKQRFTSVPGGIVNSWNGGAPAANGSIYLVGSGTDGNTACGALTACGTAVSGK